MVIREEDLASSSLALDGNVGLDFGSKKSSYVRLCKENKKHIRDLEGCCYCQWV